MRTFLKVIAFTLTEKHCMDQIVEQLHRRNVRRRIHTDVFRGEGRGACPLVPIPPNHLRRFRELGWPN
jgi:hypothetical protein